MPFRIDKPVFCLTSDVDWASEACLQDLFGIVNRFDVIPTFFGTHASESLTQWEADGRIDLGLHPNFLPGSTHGRDPGEIIDHVFSLFPKAQSFRSHCFVDDSLLCNEIYRRGIRYDSNLCLYLQEGLVPLRHNSGLTRYPCFFEDDVHWRWGKGDWSVDTCIDHFLTPGLKILNFHPKFVSFNIPDAASYEKLRPVIPDANQATIEKHRHPGPGPRTFLIDLLSRLTERGFRIHSLAEVHGMFSDMTRLM
ncbi:MAG: hypothetical protein JEY79_11955 [Pseudodesulfovibrio sp.]|nr:hypothetical protein [Pseudodesulfovibrio sp.]